MLAEISNKTGPPSIRNENAQLLGFVFVDITTADIGGYVKIASERIGKRVRFPPGYCIQWAGQFEYLKAAEKRLAILVPQHEEPGRQTLVESHRAWHRAGKFVLRLVRVSLSFGYCNGCICGGQSLPDHRPLGRQPCADQAIGIREWRLQGLQRSLLLLLLAPSLSRSRWRGCPGYKRGSCRLQ